MTNQSAFNVVDTEWGYQFGVDGVCSLQEAMELLALSRDTIKRRANDGLLRLGEDGGRVRVCRRSIQEYLRGIEVR